ncbi:MAG: hypothetical protein JRI68_10045 [Deltaproteobacteria bacterium]|nr:hypothetical protein [Deltaproteobacteria bacterium]
MIDQTDSHQTSPIPSDRRSPLRVAAVGALTFIALLALGSHGCSSDETTGGTGGMGGVGGTSPTGGMGGVGGTGGMAQQCEDPDDCTGEDTDCSWRTCEDGSCDVGLAAAGDPCDEEGGDVCDGQGACVKTEGWTCDEGSECLSGHCADGVCCDAACDGACVACDTTGLVGQCTPHEAGTDPEGDCTTPSTGVCDGAGACAIGNHLWSHGFGDAAPTERSWSVAVDSADNVIIAGHFAGDITFGTSPLTSLGGNDIFVAKFNAGGDHLWSDRFGDLEGQQAFGVAVDSADNIILAGSFAGAFRFGTNPILSSAGSTDVFVAKLDPNGNALWSFGFGDAAPDFCQNVVVDSSDNVILAGHFETDIDFDGTAPALTSAGGSDIFLAKLDSSGTHLHSAIYADADTQYVWDLAVDGSDNLLVAGYFLGGVDFGGGALPYGGGADAFVAKFDSTGAHQWSHSYGDGPDQWSVAVTADSAGNVILTGGFRGTADFSGTPVTSNGGWDIFLTKLDSAGNHLNSATFGDGTNWQFGWAVSTDGSDNIVFAADLAGSADFGGGPLTSAGNIDTTVVKLSQDFTHLWSTVHGAAQDQFVLDTAIDGTNHILLTGIYRSGIDFGGGSLTNAGGEDVFIAKLAP